MSCTTKSPRRVLEFAHAIGVGAFAKYSHKFSPKKFTQPQLFACLVLKEFLRLYPHFYWNGQRTAPRGRYQYRQEI